jgi:hypothetical protein
MGSLRVFELGAFDRVCSGKKKYLVHWVSGPILCQSEWVGQCLLCLPLLSINDSPSPDR